MRMTRPASQDGAIAIMVAVLAMVMFAAAAFALDGGRLWMAKRNLVTATDGSALAAASAYALGEDGCDLHAENYLGLNAPTATLEDCVFVPSATATTGYVTVQGEQSVPFIFGRFVGIPTATVESTTAAQVGFPLDMHGLRPLALCMDNEQIGDWKTWADTKETFRVPVDRDDDGCGGAAGNWGQLTFEGKSQSAKILEGHINNGYSGSVSEGDEVGGNPGLKANIESDLKNLAGQEIVIVVFDEVEGQGANATFRVVGFAAMEVVNAHLKGHPPHYLDVKAAHKLATGTCCGPPSEFDLGVRAMNICAIDVASAAANCTD